jgi:hypothetical protein
MKVPTPMLGGAMARDKMFACEECAEEFVVPGSLYARRDWVLQCPCCGGTDVLLVAEVALEPAVVEAA